MKTSTWRKFDRLLPFIQLGVAVMLLIIAALIIVAADDEIVPVVVLPGLVAGNLLARFYFDYWILR